MTPDTLTTEYGQMLTDYTEQVFANGAQPALVTYLQYVRKVIANLDHRYVMVAVSTPDATSFDEALAKNLEISGHVQLSGYIQGAKDGIVVTAELTSKGSWSPTLSTPPAALIEETCEMDRDIRESWYTVWDTDVPKILKGFNTLLKHNPHKQQETQPMNSPQLTPDMNPQAQYDAIKVALTEYLHANYEGSDFPSLDDFINNIVTLTEEFDCKIIVRGLDKKENPDADRTPGDTGLIAFMSLDFLGTMRGANECVGVEIQIRPGQGWRFRRYTIEDMEGFYDLYDKHTTEEHAKEYEQELEAVQKLLPTLAILDKLLHLEAEAEAVKEAAGKDAGTEGTPDQEPVEEANH